jgi:hypothetical protein
MTIRFFTPIAWAMALGLVCAQAGADVSQVPPDAEARIARVQASASVWSMESAARRARIILQKARRSGDAREVGCADESLSRVDMALRAGREHAVLVLEAWGRGDARVARGELARVAAAAEAARRAGADAELCVEPPHPAEGTTVRLIIEEP